MNLQQLIQAIKDMSTSSRDLAQLLQQLKVSEESLQSQPQKVIDALSVVHPSRESLGYLFLLHSVGSQGLPEHGNEQFLATAANFLATCEVDQIILAPDKFVSLCRQVKDHAAALGSLKLAIRPLRDGLQKLAPTAEHVTPIHADFAFSCLETKQYSVAASTLQQTMYDVDPSKTSLKPTDLLLFCYYGSMIHIGRRRYTEALQMLLQGLTAPTFVVNAITVAIYKKYALVSLIHNGSIPALPKFTPAAVNRFIKNEAPAYTDLATAYSSKKQQDLPSAIEKHQAHFVELQVTSEVHEHWFSVSRILSSTDNTRVLQDGNMGLVKLVLAGRTKRAIQKLTQTFLTLSLTDIAQQVGLENALEAESHILRMVDAGEIFAEIDSSAGMVRFLEDPEQYTSPGALQRLNETIQASFTLAQKLQAVNTQVSIDPAYVSKLNAREKGDRFPEDPSDLDAEPQSLAYPFQDD